MLYAARYVHTCRLPVSRLELTVHQHAEAALAAAQRTPGAQTNNWTCRQTRCQNLIYPTSKWKTCQPCRQRYRQYVRERSEREPKWQKQDLVDDEGHASDTEVLLTPGKIDMFSLYPIHAELSLQRVTESVPSEAVITSYLR